MFLSSVGFLDEEVPAGVFVIIIVVDAGDLVAEGVAWMDVGAAVKVPRGDSISSGLLVTLKESWEESLSLANVGLSKTSTRSSDFVAFVGSSTIFSTEIWLLSLCVGLFVTSVLVVVVLAEVVVDVSVLTVVVKRLAVDNDAKFLVSIPAE